LFIRLSLHHQNMFMKRFIPAVALVLMLPFVFSCVSSKKFKSVLADYDTLRVQYLAIQGNLGDCSREKNQLQRQLSGAREENTNLNAKVADLNKQIDFLKESQTAMLKQLQDLSVLSAAQAESIRKSLENIGAKDAYILDLQAAIARKDSMNMNLVMNLKGALGNLEDKDINIKVDKGVVYIDISDKLLFKSGRFDITDKAKQVLGKVATVLKNQPEIEFMVEGHTDNVPFTGGVLMDNWDLSVKRATTVVRVLQKEYGLNPARMAAAGRAEYNPVADNTTSEGKAANRRTRIVILPQLDQFFQLLEKKI
jgi:chemotaxis protein MotB